MSSRVRISDRLNDPAPVFSFELFPPKSDQGELQLFFARCASCSGADLSPDFVSSLQRRGLVRERTLEVATRIESELGAAAGAPGLRGQPRRAAGDPRSARGGQGAERPRAPRGSSGVPRTGSSMPRSWCASSGRATVLRRGRRLQRAHRCVDRDRDRPPAGQVEPVDFLITQLFYRQRLLLRFRPARPPGHPRSRSSRGSCPWSASTRSSASPACAGRPFLRLHQLQMERVKDDRGHAAARHRQRGRCRCLDLLRQGVPASLLP